VKYVCISIVLKDNKGEEITRWIDMQWILGTGAKLDSKRSEIFHTGLFLCKRAWPNIQQAILVLCTRVRDPNQADWEKLMRVMKYLNGTKGENLTLSADDLRVVKWYVDASFAVHPDFKSHTSTMMTLGKGAMQSIVRKQKLNVQSSTEGKLVAVHDAATMILWRKLFLEAKERNFEGNKCKEKFRETNSRTKDMLLLYNQSG
jgi:hypothetical protein